MIVYHTFETIPKHASLLGEANCWLNAGCFFLGSYGGLSRVRFVVLHPLSGLDHRVSELVELS